MDNENNTVKLGEVFNAVEIILKAAQSEGGKRAMLAHHIGQGLCQVIEKELVDLGKLLF